MGAALIRIIILIRLMITCSTGLGGTKKLKENRYTTKTIGGCMADRITVSNVDSILNTTVTFISTEQRNGNRKMIVQVNNSVASKVRIRVESDINGKEYGKDFVLKCDAVRKYNSINLEG